MNIAPELAASRKLKKPRLTGSTFANVLVVVAVACIPFMYGATLSSAYQDPVERIGHIQAAVVNEDTEYTASLISGEKKTVNIGKMLTDALTEPDAGEDTGFTWSQMTREQAIKAIDDQDIRAILYIPAGLSKEVAQIGTEDAPKAVGGRVELVTDDGINYLAGTLARSVAATLQDRVSSEASDIYAEALLDALGQVRVGMTQAADGAGALNDGATTLASGLTQLDDGAKTASAGAQDLHAGAGQLDDGLGQLAAQVPTLEAGVSQLDGGASKLSAGASTLNTGLSQYTDGVDQVAAGSHVLRSKVPELLSGISDLHAGTTQLAEGSSELDTQFQQISGPVGDLADLPEKVREVFHAAADSASGLLQQCTDDLGADSAICKVLDDIVRNQQVITSVVDSATAKADEAAQGILAAQDAIDQIADGASKVDAGVDTLQKSVGSLDDTADDQTVVGALNTIDGALSLLSSNSSTLRDGAAQLSDGGAALQAGTHELSSKMPTLADAIGRLDDGAGQLDEGSATLASGLGTLASGLDTASVGGHTLAEGTTQLSEALTEGADRLPDYKSDEASQIAKTSSSLIQVDPVRANEVSNAGAGFAPMFLSLALWVGGIAVFLVLPALDRRPGPGETWWMAALRPARTAAIFAVIQATLAVFMTNWLVELHASELLPFLGIAILASLTFVAVNQACIAMMGYRGRFVSIVLLLVQIASMGATFPVETMPAFFNWVHPLLPMSYTQLSFRAAIAGSGVPHIIGHTVAILVLWLSVSAGFVALGAYIRVRNQPLPYDAALLPDNDPDLDNDPVAQARRDDLKKQLRRSVAERRENRGIVAGAPGTLGTVGPRSEVRHARHKK